MLSAEIQKTGVSGIFKHNKTNLKNGTLRAVFAVILFTLTIVSIPQTLKAQNPGHAGNFSVLLNEKGIQLLDQRLSVDLDSPRAVFLEILKQLPKTVKVYPTENYYYFHFFHDGQRYAGNIRLAQPGITSGKVMFNYFLATTSWHFDEEDHFAIFEQKDGVKINSHSPLQHTITVDGVSVRFELNDLSRVQPPENFLAPGETYLGPVFDESGMEFYLIYNKHHRQFAFFLNQNSAKRDKYIPFSKGSALEQGLRTGFVYWFNKARNRRLLVAIYEQNAELNNTFDGPFDQLPDNFIKGEMLRKAILHARPDVKGKIDRFGNFTGEKQRFLISPYLTYFNPEDLKPLALCIKKTNPNKVEDCIISAVPSP